jgi:DNA polymerase-3 subunit alpha
MYSLLDSISKPEKIVEHLQKIGQTVFAQTDHGNAYNAPLVEKIFEKSGIKYIYGCEMYICEDMQVKDPTNWYWHILLLAKNEEGRQNLNRIISKGNIDGFYHKPRIDLKTLTEHKEGIIVSSACMKGELSSALLNNEFSKAEEIAERYKQVFGDDYYIEVQSHENEEQQRLNTLLYHIAEKCEIKTIITCDSHYVNKEDSELHSIFVQIGQEREVGETYNDCYIQSEDDIFRTNKVFSADILQKMIDNTQEIADKCNARLPFSAAIIPHIKLPMGYKNEMDMLEHLSLIGWDNIGIDKKPNVQEYKDRLIYELNAIKKMGFEGYYLLVHSYTEKVKRLGLGRGSGGGSLVAYLLNIVQIDPIEYGLYFERFIDVGQLAQLEAGIIGKDKLKIPDFDTDVAASERDSILDIIVKEYGEDNVISIGTFQYLWAKSAIKDIGRILEIDYGVLNEITSGIISRDLTDEVIENEIDKKYIDQYPKLFEIACQLTSIPRSFSTHASGKIITIKDAQYYMPVSVQNGVMVVQASMKATDALGLVKIDLLGLRTLDLIHDVLDMIGEDKEFIHRIPLNEKETMKLFQTAQTDGCFQFESQGMKSTLKKLIPTKIDDLIAVNALFRPGAMKYIDNFCDRKHGVEKVSYLHPDLEEITKDTYGILVFQEELIQIGRLAGLSNPDLLRQATGKKDYKLMEQVKPELVAGLTVKGWAPEKIEQLWNDMIAFASYSFNKCIAGSETILLSSSNHHKPLTVEEMYLSLNNLEYAKQNKRMPVRSKYQKNGYGVGFSMNSDYSRIKQNKIIDIQPSGVRSVLKFLLEDGTSLKCTENHKIPTSRGIVLAENIFIGELLYTKGDYQHTQYCYNLTDGNFDSNLPKKGQRGFQKRPEGQQSKFSMFSTEKILNKCSCEICNKEYSTEATRTRFETHHIDGDRHNNSKDNLQWLCVSCHKKEGYKTGRARRGEKGYPVSTKKVVGIEKLPPETTYDITMNAPNHNFILRDSGVVVCNSHSAAYALTAYITAYLRAHYPLEFWSCLLNSYEGKIEDVKGVLVAMKRANAPIAPPSYHRVYPICRVEDGQVVLGTNIMKNLNKAVASQFGFLNSIEIKTLEVFIDLLVYLEEIMDVNSRQISSMIKAGFFSTVAPSSFLLDVQKTFNEKYSKNYVEKTKTKRIGSLHAWVLTLHSSSILTIEESALQAEVLGVPLFTSSVGKDVGCVISVQPMGKSGEKITICGLNSGRISELSIYKQNHGIKDGDIIRVLSVNGQSKYRMPSIASFLIVRKGE